jgi:hypothetical protein
MKTLEGWEAVPVRAALELLDGGGPRECDLCGTDDGDLAALDSGATGEPAILCSRCRLDPPFSYL